ncbi:MAG: 3-deoxy-manno-octulosonate cytidylyltransferase [Ignavibacteria bacterium]|nr:3-deoxy-manno-octulosonate cytidylyltransferase [Ignavibacteria bacterium]
MNRIVAIIPARYGSSRLPGKPLADLIGKPMIQHVYERTARAGTIDWCLVATDDERIANAVRSFGGHAVMTPENLETGTDRVAFVARSLEKADLIVNIQGDEPLIEPAMIDEAVRLLAADPGPQVGTLVTPMTDPDDLDDPGVVKVVIDSDNRALYFSRSPIPFVRGADQSQRVMAHRYYKHIGLYVYRRPFLLRLTEVDRTPLEMAEELEQLRILETGQEIRVGITSYTSIPVDTPADLESVRSQMQAEQ